MKRVRRARTRAVVAVERVRRYVAQLQGDPVALGHGEARDQLVVAEAPRAGAAGDEHRVVAGDRVMGAIGSVDEPRVAAP